MKRYSYIFNNSNLVEYLLARPKLKNKDDCKRERIDDGVFIRGGCTTNDVDLQQWFEVAEFSLA